jgi:purine-cytosine permease-like protein
VPEAPATVQSVLTFASLIAGFMIPFGGTVSDFGIYIDPSASRYAIYLPPFSLPAQRPCLLTPSTD